MYEHKTLCLFQNMIMMKKKKKKETIMADKDEDNGERFADLSD